MITDPLKRLRAANPEPWCPPPPIDEVWRRIEADDRRAHDRVAARPRRLQAKRVRPRSLPGAMLALSSIAVVIAVGAIALLLHGRGPVAGDSASAQQLVARLAVLQRPQTAADMLPADVHITNPQGTIIPRFTRLVRTLPDARLFLVVTSPNARSNPVWSLRLGDQVAIVEISGTHATQTVPVPAADLSNANDVFLISLSGLGSRFQPGAYYVVGIVPDGVARARWTFATNQFEPGAVLDVSVADNVAVTRARPGTPPAVLRAAWYAPDGRRVATSNQALRAAQAAHDAVLKAQAIRSDLQQRYHADRSLLDAFAAFAINSRTGVKTAAGDLISRPPLSSVPLAILQSPPRMNQLAQLDFTQLREVITPSGGRLYLIPGREGLCLAAVPVNSSPFPDGFLGGGGGSACSLLADAESHGMTLTIGYFGVRTNYRMVPKTIHSITVRTSGGARKTIALPDGIYVSPSQRTSR
jgi:hypothetical protein